MSYLLQANSWLFQQLSGSAALTAALASPTKGFAASIYPDSAPESSAYPFVLYSLVDGDNINVQDLKVGTTFLFLVKAIVEGTNPASALALADLIDAVLTPSGVGASSANWNGYRINCVQQKEWQQGDVQSGKSYRQAGNQYLITVR